jgi:hypothetical protein
MERHREQTHCYGPGFPEDKYDFKLQKDERTFAQNLLHAAALDFVLIRRISGSNVGPNFGEGDNPSRDVFKTKADVVKFMQEAVAGGAKVIQQQGDAGLDNTSKGFGNRMAHNSNLWTFAIEHSGEHYEINQRTMEITIKLKRPEGQYSIYENPQNEKKDKPASDPNAKPQP